MNKRELDYLLIPDSSRAVKKEREERALKEIKNRHVGKVILLNGKDSEEDILFLGRVLKKGDRIGFDTFPLHFREYIEIIKKAKKEGKFPKRIKIELIETPQSFREEIYGELGLYEEKIFHKRVTLLKERNEFFQKIKSFVKKIISL